MRAGGLLLLTFLPACLLAPRSSEAQELSVLLGRLETVRSSHSARAWQVDFRNGFGKYFAVSGAYLNEGHTPGHKRDGLTAQVWGRIPLFHQRASLDLGVGPYRYYDTRPLPGGGYVDAHGWAAIYSLTGTYHTDSPWFFRLALNRIDLSREEDTNTYMVGLGYHLWEEPYRAPGRSPEPPTDYVTHNELSALLGQTVVNSFQDQRGLAGALEFRKGIARNIDWTLTWLNEGNEKVIRRNGLASQLWLVDDYLDRRVDLGVGAGAYYFVDRKRAPIPGQEGRSDLAGLLSTTASYRFGGSWSARFLWNRVVSSSNTDTDIFLFGIGYRWRD